MRHFLLVTVLATALVPLSVGAKNTEAVVDSSQNQKTISDGVTQQAIQELTALHGPSQVDRIRKGVAQAAMYWRTDDGNTNEFIAMCREQFVASGPDLDDLRVRFETNLEALSGHGVALTRKLREPVDLDIGKQLPVDLLFATLNPFDHLSEDVFRTRIAFSALLNFPMVNLDETINFSRQQWADARLADEFSSRVPGDVLAAQTVAYTKAEDYIAHYNIAMGSIVAPDGRKPFPKDLKLISHWGLRDHIKALYADPVKNLKDQRLIYKVMQRIIAQDIPAIVIDNPAVTWDPNANTVDGSPADREPDTRYARILEVFAAERLEDAVSPRFPTHIDRKFMVDREIPEARVEELLLSVLSSDTAKAVGKAVAGRLGRDLEPFDIWYDGFKGRSRTPEDMLDKMVHDKYPTLADFQADLPNVLGKLGFDAKTAAFLKEHIVVDGARGAGHAMGAGMRSDSAHLRTRVPSNGMDYKGYNIALHELGHCVEQVFSLNRVDNTILAGVPNTAFTEAFAFVFQSRDLDVLGLSQADSATLALKALDAFWSTFEIGGVGVLDLRVWRWMYAHPDANAAELKTATIAMAKELWNQYYEPIFGHHDSSILAIYSHMVAYGMYLPDYPIGFLIQAQIEDAIAGKNLATEMERMCVQGRIAPDAWMVGAVGQPLSSGPLIKAADRALETIE